MSKTATAKVVQRENGVTVLALEINGKPYGDYPIGGGSFDVVTQITEMVADAADYGIDSVSLS